MKDNIRRKTDKINAKKQNLVADIFVYGSISFMVLWVCLFGFWEFYPYQVITVANARMTSPVVYQGEVTSYESDYTKSTNIEATVTRQFVDGLIFDAGSCTSNLPVSSGRAISEISIPETLPPGQYHLVITLKYKVNPIRTIEVKYKSSDFTVLENTSNGVLENKESDLSE